MSNLSVNSSLLADTSCSYGAKLSFIWCSDHVVRAQYSLSFSPVFQHSDQDNSGRLWVDCVTKAKLCSTDFIQFLGLFSNCFCEMEDFAFFFGQIEPFEKFRSFFVGSANNPRPLIILQRAPSRHSFVRSHKSNVWEPRLESTMFQSFLCKTLVWEVTSNYKEPKSWHHARQPKI